MKADIEENELGEPDNEHLIEFEEEDTDEDWS